MKTANRKFPKTTSRTRVGSALILTVVLTSMLAIVGMMFVMAARVDKMSTSAIAENKELNFAVETIVAKLSQELILDVPRAADPNREYYDYPDEKNAWLASLEPYEDGTDYYWRQISDVTGFLKQEGFGRQHVEVELPTTQRPKPSESFVREYPEINVDEDGDFLDKNGNLATEGLWADADGDGVADSKWIELDDITSSKGRPIYAAIRVIDNGGMLNVNTAYKFDPTGSLDEIDGRSLTQINLAELSQRGANGTLDVAALDLHDERRGTVLASINDYERDVIWRYNEPNRPYTPFDISDELELRNRFVLNHPDIDTRIEGVWGHAFRGNYFLRTPVDGASDLVNWFTKAQYDLSEPNASDNYSYRHIGTTYNMDRIIDPDGGKMLNINDANVSSLYSTIRKGIDVDPFFIDEDEIAAQIAVNLIDFRDNDSNVTTIDVGVDTYYGFERPCIYISELAHKFVWLPGPPPTIYRSYAVELYKPYFEDNDPNDWRLVIDGTQIDIDSWTGSEQFYVIRNQDPLALLDVDLNAATQSSNALTFSSISTISLQRKVFTNTGSYYITVDYEPVPDANATSGWLVEPTVLLPIITQSIQRDITRHKCIRRLWSSASDTYSPTLGYRDPDDEDDYRSGDPDMIQAHPANRDFTNVGEIGILFREGAYYRDSINRPDRIGYSIDTDEEEEVRLDLADPNFQKVFKYLTVMDPTRDNIDNDGDGDKDEYSDPPIAGDELKVPGRININTAPWYVIAQLPWMRPEIAQAIVDYRDKHNLSSSISGIDYSPRETATGINNLREAEGFASIGELTTVINVFGQDDYDMHYYELDLVDLDGFPDLTPGGSTGDGAEDDFEERDVIFARISNLVTVRSDVFTAYILVRIGADGPQKRAVAILDRSDVYSAEGRVRVRALHPVSDPR